MTAGPPSLGVLLSNLGSPTAPTPAAVRVYLREFLADPRVVDLPRLRWWLIRNLFILPFRPRRSARLYRSIWTDRGSPLAVTTERIARALERRLGVGGATVPVAVGMRYGEPGIASAVRRLESDGCERIVVLPLYPQYSRTTTASTFDALARAATTSEIRTVESYFDHPGYLAALEASIREHRETAGRERRLVLSYHGLPRRYAEAGDPYPRQCAATTKTLVKRLGLAPGEWHMAYQSRFGREEWLRPDLEQRLQRWGGDGVDGIDVVCPGFAADCLETLEEVAETGRRGFEAAGGRGFAYIPALNDREDHIAALAAIVAETAGDWFDQNTSSR